MNRRTLDENRISQLRDIIRIAQDEIDAINNRNYSSVAFQRHIEQGWFTKRPSTCTMPQGHPSHCGCEW